MIAKRVENIASSKTMVISAKAVDLIAKGENVINLSVGEPDFPTPERIKNAAIDAINNNHTKYTVNNGLLELRKAIADRIYADYGVSYSTDEIIVSNGAKQALFSAILALLEEGDEAIVPAPYYVTYPEAIKFAGAKPVFVETKEEEGFKLTPEALMDAITEDTKVLVLCSPCNPTGATYKKEELEALAIIAQRKGLFIITDEIYDKLLYDNFDYTSLPSLAETIKYRTVLINGVSKSYAMTGWRIGYACANREIIAAMSKIQSHNTSGACSVSQYASIEALSGPQDDVEEMRKEFEKRRNYFADALNNIKGISATRPEGAFYIFANVKETFGKKIGGKKITNSHDFAMALIDEAKVVGVPGSAFGMEGYIRFSFSSSLETLKEAVKRISELLG